jgi:drug/metabolite transporter (DMT)-like permease
MDRRQIVAVFSLLLVALIWGATFVMVKEAVSQIGVFTFLALRFLLAAFVLALIFWPRLRASSPREFLAGALVGLFLFGGYALQTIGLKYTSVSKTGFITGLSVVVVPLLSTLLFRQKQNLTALVGVLLATTGLGLLTLRGLSMAQGDLWVLGGAVAFALQIVALGRFAPQMETGSLATIQVATVALLSAPLAWAMEGSLPQMSEQLWFAILFTGIMATSLAFLVQSKAQRFTSPTHTALIFATEPVFAAIFGYLLLQERLGSREILGCALILAGMAVGEIGIFNKKLLSSKRE